MCNGYVELPFPSVAARYSGAANKLNMLLLDFFIDGNEALRNIFRVLLASVATKRAAA
jgi:hypothetical protein